MRESSTPIDCESLVSVVQRESAPGVLEEVCAQHLPSLYRTAYRFLGNSADAEDAVQDALLSAYKHLHEFRGESQLSTWLTVPCRALSGPSFSQNVGRYGTNGIRCKTPSDR